MSKKQEEVRRKVSVELYSDDQEAGVEEPMIRFDAYVTRNAGQRKELSSYAADFTADLFGKEYPAFYRHDWSYDVRVPKGDALRIMGLVPAAEVTLGYFVDPEPNETLRRCTPCGQLKGTVVDRFRLSTVEFGTFKATDPTLGSATFEVFRDIRFSENFYWFVRVTPERLESIKHLLTDV